MKKIATLYQATAEEAFTKNMMARFGEDYASMDEMEGDDIFFWTSALSCSIRKNTGTV